MAMVLAVALMVALVTPLPHDRNALQRGFHHGENPGKENMEIITKEGSKINRYTPSEDQQASGKWGKKVGIACELENGEIIYADYLCAGGNLPMSMFYYIFAPAQKR